MANEVGLAVTVYIPSKPRMPWVFKNSFVSNIYYAWKDVKGNENLVKPK